MAGGSAGAMSHGQVEETGESARRIRPTVRRLAVVAAVLGAVATPLAVAAAPQHKPATGQYQVRSGDTVTSIASRLHVKGGWQELYAANRGVVGTDPNRLVVGMTLTIPGGPAPTNTGGYVVRSGDTLTTIADRMRVPGGRDALYRANRQTIGANPNRLEIGQVLVSPGAPATGAGAVAQRAPGNQAAPGKAAVVAGPAAPAPAAAPAVHHGSRTWLWVIGLIVGALILCGLLAIALGRRRRRNSASSGSTTLGLGAGPRPMDWDRAVGAELGDPAEAVTIIPAPRALAQPAVTEERVDVLTPREPDPFVEDSLEWPLGGAPAPASDARRENWQPAGHGRDDLAWSTYPAPQLVDELFDDRTSADAGPESSR
jgi:LysM repeat protein